MSQQSVWDALHKYKHPGNIKVRLTFFWASNSTSDPAKTLADKAAALLGEHGMGIDVYPSMTKTAAHTLPFQEKLYLDDHALELRHKAHGVFQDKKPRLPVIFCPFRGEGGGGDGPCSTNGMCLKGTNWLPFVLINSELMSPDNVTLLHEIGHAAGLMHMATGANDAVKNFMGYQPTRTGMLRNQVVSIAQSYFSI